jgi:hypothetical protein
MEKELARAITGKDSIVDFTDNETHPDGDLTGRGQQV